MSVPDHTSALAAVQLDGGGVLVAGREAANRCGPQAWHGLAASA
jgi:hypothetical protein